MKLLTSLVFVALCAASGWLVLARGDGVGTLAAALALPAAADDAHAVARASAGLAADGLGADAAEAPTAPAIAARTALAAVIAGRAVDGGGRPIAGAEVALVGPHGAGAIARSGPDGAFTVRATGRRERELALGVRHPGHAATVVRPGATTEVGDVVLAPAAAATGRILSIDGSPLAGARVCYRVADGRPARRALEAWIPPVTTGPAGTFELGGLPAGAFALEVEFDGRFTIATATARLGEGERLAVADIVVDRGTALSGVVRDRSGRPVGGARVLARPTSADDATDRRSEATTGTDGRFVLEAVPSRGAELEVRHERFVAARLEVVDPLAAARIEITLDPCAHLTGVVVDSVTRRPITRFDIRARRIGAPADPIERAARARAEIDRRLAAAGLAVADTPTAQAPRSVEPETTVRRTGPPSPHPDGAFSTSGLQPGRYLLDLRAPGYAPVAFGPVEIEAGREPAPVTIALEPGTALAGTVRDARSRAPIAGARVRLLAAATTRGTGGDEEDFRRLFAGGAGSASPDLGAEIAEARSSADGSFDFGAQRPGRFRVVADARGHATATLDDVVVAAAAPRRDLEVVLAAASSVHGTVRDAAPGDRVELRRIGGGTVAAAVDRDGAYEAPDLEPGGYWVTLRRAGNDGPSPMDLLRERGREPDLVLAPGERARHDVDPAGGRFARFTAGVTIDGLAAGGATVELQPLGAETARAVRAQAGEDGHATMGRVVPGRYRVLVRDRGAVVLAEELVLPSGRTTERRFDAWTGAIELAVHEPGGAAVDGVLIRLALRGEVRPGSADWSAAPSYREALTAGGRASLRGLPAGDWVWAVTGPAGEHGDGACRVPAGAAARVTVELRRAAGSELDGRARAR